MKGKKTKTCDTMRREGVISSGSEISDTTDAVTKRRQSDRMKRRSRTNSFVKNQKSSNMVDSAYDGDEESATNGTSPDKKLQTSDDPYALDNMEEVVSVVPTNKKSKRISNAKPRPVTKASKKISRIPTYAVSPHTTSTPVLESHAQKGKRRSIVVDSPEVTPILPVTSPMENGSSGDHITPFNRRSTRKRPLPLDSDTPTLPTPLASQIATLSCSSQGDSGIGISPLPKKYILSNAKDSGPKDAKTKKRKHAGKKNNEQHNVSFFNEIQNSENPTKSGHNESPSKKRKALILKSRFQSESNIINAKSPPRNDDSCFGFSPVPSTPPSSRKKANPRAVFSPASNYRSAKELCLSNSPSTESLRPGSQGSGGESLFSDDMFLSDVTDSLELNKSTRKSYNKVLKLKKSKIPVKKTTKIDTWASTFNNEIAAIEKFELNIE